MDLATLSEARRRFGTGRSQHARLIMLASAHDAALPQSPLAERVRGREAVNDLYRFDVDAIHGASKRKHAAPDFWTRQGRTRRQTALLAPPFS